MYLFRKVSDIESILTKVIDDRGWHVLPRFHAIGCVDKSDDLEYAEIIYYPDFVEDAKMYAW